MDHPNERSSHSTPTPRGGGLVIAAVVLLSYLISSYLLSFELAWPFAAGAFVVVLVSWLDDVYSISFVWRLLAHSAAAGLLVYYARSAAVVAFPGIAGTIDLGYLGNALIFCWIIWLVNAYNFMDGIDGIAGVQAVAAGLGWLIIGLVAGVPPLYMLGGLVMFTSFAFLLHNWPPARIFMGDSGSAFLGFVFAGLPLLIRTENGIDAAPLFVVSVILVWLFVFDSVFTFLRRLFRGERVWQAHREHLYQRLVVSGYSHRRTTLIYGSLSLLNAIAAGVTISRGDQRSALTLIALLATESAGILILCARRKCLWGKNS